jgi:hypothetical protein
MESMNVKIETAAPRVPEGPAVQPELRHLTINKFPVSRPVNRRQSLSLKINKSKRIRIIGI